MHDSLRVFLWFRTAQHIYWTERNLLSWDLYSCVCRRGCYRFIRSDQYPYIGEDQVDCLCGSGLCLHCWFVIPCIDQFKVLTLPKL